MNKGFSKKLKIYREIARDFKGMLSVHSTKEVAKIMKDWTVETCTEIRLNMTKVINGEKVIVICMHNGNFLEAIAGRA